MKKSSGRIAQRLHDRTQFMEFVQILAHEEWECKDCAEVATDFFLKAFLLARFDSLTRKV
jgi:hypothetical protein